MRLLTARGLAGWRRSWAGCSCSAAAQSHSALIRMPINATRSLARTLSMHRWQLTGERNAARRRGTTGEHSSAAHTNSAGAPRAALPAVAEAWLDALCVIAGWKVQTKHALSIAHLWPPAWDVLRAQVVVLPGLRPAAALRVPHRPHSRSPHTRRHSKGHSRTYIICKRT